MDLNPNNDSLWVCFPLNRNTLACQCSPGCAGKIGQQGSLELLSLRILFSPLSLDTNIA